MLPASFQLPAAIVLLVGGVISCFAGYRVFRIVLGIYGFILGALLTSGAAVRVNDAAREHGQIRAFNGADYNLAKNLPTVVLRNEDYGRITRILADNTPVTLEFTITNRTFPAGKTSYNAIAEIPGSDKADEVVMLGGHLDSSGASRGQQAREHAIVIAQPLVQRIGQDVEHRPAFPERGRTGRVADGDELIG